MFCRHRYFVSRAVPVADGDGGIREWVGALTDVDELARAEAAQREYGALSAFAADVGTALVQRDPLPGVLQRCAASIVLHLGATFARLAPKPLAPNRQSLFDMRRVVPAMPRV
jgi:hypothetical protein